MTLKDRTQALRIEPRWPVALAIVTVIVLLAVLPRGLRLIPPWLTCVGGIVVLVPFVAVELTAAQARRLRLERAIALLLLVRWLRIERVISLLLFVYGAIAIFTNLARLITAMVHGSAEIGGVLLLTSSIGVWFGNVLIFSVSYWQIDRGGPERRMNDASVRPDWLFPQESAPAEHVPPGWQPVFVDYLFLGFSTATAFSTTDVMPLTSRAKMLMMLESSISLVTIVVVASRAINILSS